MAHCQWDWYPMGHKSRDLGLGLGHLGRLGLEQISLEQSRDKNLWDNQIPNCGTTWDSSLMGFWSPIPCPSLVLKAKDLCSDQEIFLIPDILLILINYYFMISPFNSLETYLFL